MHYDVQSNLSRVFGGGSVFALDGAEHPEEGRLHRGSPSISGMQSMTVVIVLAAVFFLGMGLFALALPAALIRPFGITLPIPESRAEVRAVYGGFGLAIAGMLVLALMNHPAREGILITVAAALGGMGFGRLVSGVVDRPKAFYPNWFYFVVEVAGAGTLFWAATGR